VLKNQDRTAMITHMAIRTATVTNTMIES